MPVGTKGRVLVVDDDQSMREAIESLLDAADIASTGYASAEELLAVGAIDDAVCVISDLKLPAMSGIALLDTLRARGAKLPVIVITAHDTRGTHDNALYHGAAAYLPKPFSGRALLDAIERVRQA